MKTDLLVIGGSAGGLHVATTAKKLYGDIKITLVRKTNTVMVPCGIPYIFGTLKDVSINRIPDTMLKNANVELIIDEVIKVDHEKKCAFLANHEEIQYEKLVIATGSKPIVPQFIPGSNLENVFPIFKDEDYLSLVLKTVNEKTNVVVIGGGFIGVEFAEQLSIAGKTVTLIELEDKCLWAAFDDDFCKTAEDDMRNNGIIIKTGVKVAKIQGKEKVEEVVLENGEIIPTDIVILGMGVIPNTDLSQEAGVLVDKNKAIVVDEYMRTNLKDVFAVGDCAQKKCFFTGKPIPVLLASTAAMEAKVAASNLYKLAFIRENKGTISAFSTKIFGKTYAACGITERRALTEGFDVVTGEFTTMDKHPGSLPGTNKLSIKLIFNKKSYVLMGASLVGGSSVGEMINILSLAVQKSLTANELHTFQVATHPLLTASPIAYPINIAALNALTK